MSGCTRHPINPVINLFSRPSQDAPAHGDRGPTNPAYRKTRRLVLAVLVVYGVLVATHDGEFWPFSVYQMFSSAGRPWTRVIVREVPSVPPAPRRWTSEDLEALPGRPFAMSQHGVLQNDVTAYVARTTAWTKTRGDGLRALLGYEQAAGHVLAVYRMDGRLAEDGAVVVTGKPVLYLAPDTLLVNANLHSDATSRTD